MTKPNLITKLTAIQDAMKEALDPSHAKVIAGKLLAELIATLRDEEDEELKSEGAEMLARAGATHTQKIPPGEATAATLLPACDEALARSIIEGFTATLRLWDGTAKRHYEAPDVRTRLETAKLYLNYRLGMPVQMMLKVESSSFKDREQELVDMAKTPSGRTMLLRMQVIDETWLANHAKQLDVKSQ